MPLARQGYFSWPRMRGFMWGNFAMAHGIQPSIASLTCARQLVSYAEGGTLGVHYGSRSEAFPDCHLKQLTQTLDGEGRQVEHLTIEDRRWRWRNLGRISGYYNVVATGSQLRPHSRKGLRDLLGLALTELRESRFDITRIDNDPDNAPTVEWDYEEPVVALAQLLEFGRLRLALRGNSQVVIYPKGVGVNITVNDRAIMASRPISAPDRPSHLVVAFGRSEFEISFELEPVALNRRLQWVPLDEVEYVPQSRNVAGQVVKTWAYTVPGEYSNIADAFDRDLAERSAFRAYRIKTGFKVQGQQNRIVSELTEILPILKERAKTREINGVEIRLPANVRGIFNGGYENPEPKRSDEEQVDTKFGGIRYAREFEILENDGVVLFADPLYRTIDTGGEMFNEFRRAGGGVIRERIPRYITAPASPLYLTTAYNLREKKGKELGGWIRHEESFPISSAFGNNRPVYIRDDHWCRQCINSREDKKPEKFHNDDNLRSLRPFAQQIARGELQRLQFTEGRMVNYAGMQSIFPDGLVAQVNWSVDGEGVARTDVTVHIEDLTNYQPTREYLAMIKADREASVLRSIEKNIDEAKRRAL